MNLEFVFGAIFAGIFLAFVVYVWYKGSKLKDTSTVKVLQYNNVYDANLGIQTMVRDGWSVKNMDTTDGHINVGRTATYTILTGGLALFLGGSRSSGKITVLFERAPVVG